MSRDERTSGFDLSGCWAVLRRRWHWIAVGVLVSVLLGVVSWKKTEALRAERPEFEVTTRIRVPSLLAVTPLMDNPLWRPLYERTDLVNLMLTSEEFKALLPDTKLANRLVAASIGYFFLFRGVDSVVEFKLRYVGESQDAGAIVDAVLKGLDAHFLPSLEVARKSASLLLSEGSVAKNPHAMRSLRSYIDEDSFFKEYQSKDERRVDRAVMRAQGGSMGLGVVIFVSIISGLSGMMMLILAFEWGRLLLGAKASK
jgi:hypothetical protein